jgi:two-component system, chemotaxis family, protein-glutamate methylesterase/glutaminase
LSRDFEDSTMAAMRCHVGHRFTEDSLVGAQTEAVEAALWNAVRVLREKAMFARHLAQRAAERNVAIRGFPNYSEVADEAEQQAGLIEALLTGPQSQGPEHTPRERPSGEEVPSESRSNRN